MSPASSSAAPAPAASPRHGWAWAVLPADARRAEVYGDTGLATLLQAAGVAVGDGAEAGGVPPDAILVAGAELSRPDLAAMATRLAPGGIVALVVEGRAREARRLTGLLQGAGLEVWDLVTGNRSAAHALAIAGAPPVRGRGRIVIGDRGQRRPSVLEQALGDAGTALGQSPRIRRATVRGSGTLLVEISTAAGVHLLRLAAGPAIALLEAARDNVRAVGAGAPGVLADRLVRPSHEGDVGLARWTVEAKVAGRQPRRIGPALIGDCIEFLVALRARRDHGDSIARGLAGDAAAIAPHLDPSQRGDLAAVERSLVERLGDLPPGWAHNDFWPGNLLADRGRLVAVIDWDAAQPAAPPLLDLLHLLAMGDPGTRRLPHGRRCTDVLLGLARRGGDERIRAYCEATATPKDRPTLVALVTAYWLARAARDLRTFSDRAGRAGWMADNVHRPLAALVAT